MGNHIGVIGIGPGHPDLITPAAINFIQRADILAGGERLLLFFQDSGKEMFTIKNNLAELADFIRDRRQDALIAVLASGDPAFFGILEFLKKHFADSDLQVIPGISSVQAACARLCISWHDAVFYSIHGRKLGGLAALVRDNPKVIILTDPGQTPAKVTQSLITEGISNKVIYVCENLSYENERIGKYAIGQIPPELGGSGCVMVIMDEER